MKRRAAGHRAHRKDLHFLALAIQIRLGLVPIDLALLTPGVLLRDVHLQAGPQAHRAFPLAHVLPHRRFGDLHVRAFPGDAHPDAMRRVALLARRSPFWLAMGCW